MILTCCNCLFSDFKMPQSLHLTFIKMGESQSFSVTIEDDGETEETETLVLSLISSNSSDSVLVNPDILKITITDNDGKRGYYSLFHSPFICQK